MQLAANSPPLLRLLPPLLRLLPPLLLPPLLLSLRRPHETKLKKGQKAPAREDPQPLSLDGASLPLQRKTARSSSQETTISLSFK